MELNAGEELVVCNKRPAPTDGAGRSANELRIARKAFAEQFKTTSVFEVTPPVQFKHKPVPREGPLFGWGRV